MSIPTSDGQVPDAESERQIVQNLVTRSDFRDAVLRIVDERLEDEIERRAWRRGSEVF